MSSLPITPAVWGTATFSTDASRASRVVSSALRRIPYRNFSGPLAEAYDAQSSLFSAPRDGLYEITAVTSVASRNISASALKTAYVYYFVNQTPVFASAQLVAGSNSPTAHQVSTLSSSQLLELKAGDVVHVASNVPDTDTDNFLPSFTSEDDRYIVFASWLTVQSLGPPFGHGTRPWFRALDLQLAVPLSPSLQLVPFASFNGPMAGGLDPSSSIFTAPSSGLYEFSASVALFCSNPTSFSANVFLMVNSLPVWLCPQIVGGVGGLASFVSSASFSQLVSLEEGDLVCLGANYPSSPAVSSPALIYSQFSPGSLATDPLCLTWWTAQLLQEDPSPPPPALCVDACTPCCPPSCLPPCQAPGPVWCSSSDLKHEDGPDGSEQVQWFTATLSTPLSFPQNEGVLLPFSQCTGPMQAAFDTKTSLFFAPVSGAYKMSVTLSFTSPQTQVATVQVAFAVNDRQVYASDQLSGIAPSGVVSSVTLIQILDLTAGDRVLLTGALADAFPCSLLSTSFVPGYALPAPVSWWTARLL